VIAGGKAYLGCPFHGGLQCDGEAVELPDSMGDLFAIYVDYEKGFLPFAGAMSDQPNYVVEAVRLFARVDAELMQEEDEKRQIASAMQQMRNH